MAEQWPLTLEQLLNESGFQYQLGDNTIRSENETGPSKVRRRNTLPVDQMRVSVRLTKAQYSTFYNFFDVTLNGGVLEFEFDHPITETTETWRFVGAPSVAPNGGEEFVLNMTWEKTS